MTETIIGRLFSRGIGLVMSGNRRLALFDFGMEYYSIRQWRLALRYS